MPLRLSELLERIRPAGTPGAPTEGEQQREALDQAQELAELAVILEAFAREADTVIAAASATATQLDRDAHLQARQVRAAVPDRIAAIQAEAVQRHHAQDDTEQARVMNQTAAEVARLETKAAERIPPIVTATTDAIWAIVGAEPAPGDPP